MSGKKRDLKATLSSAPDKGFTLVELMISLSIGLVLFAGVLSVFVGMRTTTSETSTYGELQENGRFAISVLTDDLLRQDFWGDYVGPLTFRNLNPPIPNAPVNDCVGGGINNATFPIAAGTFRTIWGQTVTGADTDPLGCFSTPSGTRTKVNSDVIQLKRVIGLPVSAQNPAVATNFYFDATTTVGGIYTGGAIPFQENARSWEYQHHVYYVRERSVGSDYVPILMQGRLTNLDMAFSPIVDGIEVIHFMYGVDTNGSGVINAYIPATAMNDGLWNGANGARILAVKVYVLARSVLPDFKYDNTSTYQMGNVAFTVNDNYHRLLFSSTITLYNAR